MQPWKFLLNKNYTHKIKVDDIYKLAYMNLIPVSWISLSLAEASTPHQKRLVFEDQIHVLMMPVIMLKTNVTT